MGDHGAAELALAGIARVVIRLLCVVFMEERRLPFGLEASLLAAAHRLYAFGGRG